MELIEDSVWDEVEGVLSKYVDGSYESLIEQFENGQEDRTQTIAKAKDELNRCHQERQRILTIMRKQFVSEADAEIQLISINDDEKHWQKELAQNEKLRDDSDAVWQAFMSQLHELDRLRIFGFRHLSVEQKKLILNTVLKEFVLFPDGKVELRFKTPMDKKQVADTVLSLSQHDHLQSYGNECFSFRSWWFVTPSAVRSDLILFLPPLGNQYPGFGQCLGAVLSSIKRSPV